jgi:hypothetical protein
METMLLLVTLLLVKHVIADFFLQRAFMFRDKHIYAGPGGISHAATHGLLTTIAIIICLPNLWVFAILIGLFDAVAHYHIDYIKSSWNVKTKASPSENRYWYAFGLDQMAHSLTYVLIVYIIFIR